MVGQNFLRSPFGAASLLAVEVAWTADRATDPATWVWVDITDDVRQDPGVSMRFGRGDEASASQPATCMFTVNNRTGDYSKGGESSNWPNVRAGVPVRVRVDPDGGGFVDPPAFQGEAVGFTPDWSLRGNDAVVRVTAAGTLRRLGQGQAPIQSALRRGIPETEGLLAYWPCEEGPEAGGFAPGAGPYFMSWTGSPELSSSDAFASSAPLPVLAGSVWTGAVAGSSSSGVVHVRFLAEFPTNPADEGVLLSVRTSGSAARFDLVYQPATDGVLAIVVYDGFDNVIDFTPSPIAFDINLPPYARRYSFTVEQLGSDVRCLFGAIDAETADDTGFGALVTPSETLGVPMQIQINRSGFANAAGALDRVAVGQIAVYDRDPGFFDNRDELVAFRGERADTRLQRLCDESGETIEIVGQAPVMMGAQSIATLLELLRECEVADGGTLYDGRSEGLTYVARDQRENQDADLTVDAAAAQLAPPFGPVDDDQRTRNKATVTRAQAGDFTHEDADGPMGTATIGTYDTSLTVNVQDDNDARHYAEWLVHLGTQEGYRYPSVPVNLRRAPTLARSVLGLPPGSRCDLTNVADELVAFPASDDVRLLVEGLSLQLSADRFDAVLQCTSYDPWRISTVNPTDSGAAISVVGVSAAQFDGNTTGSSAAVTPTVPALARLGDLLVVFATIRNSGAGTCPLPAETDGAWSMLLQSGNTSMYARWVTPEDIALDNTTETGFDVPISGGVANATVTVETFALRGVHPDLSQLVHTSAALLNVSAANVAYPALTITEPNCLVLVAGWKQDDWTSVAAVAGMTELVDASSAVGDDAGAVIDYVVQTTATNLAAGSFVVTGGASAISRGLSLALRPAPVPDEPLRLDTDGSTLAASIAAGATSMSVAIEDSPMTYVGAGVPSAGSNVSVTPPPPAGLLAGDLLLCAAAIRNSGTGTVNTPDGWNSVVTSGNFTLLAKYSQGPTEPTPTVSFASGAANATTQAQCFAFRGAYANMQLAIPLTATQLNASAQNIAYPARTVALDGCAVVVLAWKQDDWTSVAQLAGMTEGFDSPSTLGDDAGIVMDYVIQTTAANLSAGSLVVTGGASAISRAIVLVIGPDLGRAWTTDADDYPIDLDVGGVKIVATACVDTVTPQAMTIQAAPVARTAGVPVKLWTPPVLGR